MVLEPLVHYDENGNMVPVLVEEIPTVENGGVASDLRSITYRIRKDVQWSDGTRSPRTTWCSPASTACTRTRAATPPPTSRT